MGTSSGLSDQTQRPHPSEATGQFTKRYATVATIATFLIVGITGILLFFHIGERYLRSAHEWLGMTFVIAAIFHLVRHSKTVTALLGEARTQVAIMLAVAVAVVFVAVASLSPGTYGRDRGRWHSEVSPASEMAMLPVST